MEKKKEFAKEQHWRSQNLCRRRIYLFLYLCIAYNIQIGLRDYSDFNITWLQSSMQKFGSGGMYIVMGRYVRL